jgi:hypothetical protein
MKNLHQNPFRWDQFKGVQHRPQGPAEKSQTIGFFATLAGFFGALLRKTMRYAARDERS